ncbi:hypothetical protein Tco_1047633 [Tanacetum coccineum]
MEMLQAKEDLMEAIQVFLKKYDHIPPKEKCMALLLAEERFLKPDAIMTSSPIEEPKNSLIIEDEDINTIPEKESDEENESSVENLFHIPNNCMIFSKPLFDSFGDSTSSEYSSNNESILEEDIFSNLPFKFDVESISSDVYPIYDEVLEDIDSTNYLIDSIIDFSPKIDPLLEEFAGELALINLIPSGIDEVDFDPEGDSRLVEKLSYDNSSPLPMEELNFEDIIEFFSAFPIPVEGSDFLLEETNTILSYLDDSLPELETFSFDIEEKNSGSTTTHFDNSLPIYEKFSFHDDLTKEKKSGSTTTHADTSLPKSDDVVSFPSGNRNKTFNLGISIEVQSKGFLSLNEFSISFISDPLSPVLETLLPFSSENEDKVFNPRILVSKEDKSPHLLSHWGFKAFKNIHNFLNESPMMIYGGDIPIWDVPYLHFDPP